MGPVRRRVALLLLAVVGVNASYTVLIPFVPELEHRVGATPGVIALTFALFAVAKMLAQPAGGWWVDRSSPGRVALVSLLVAAAGMVVTALARDSLALLTGRVVWGVGEGLVSPALYAGMSALCGRYGVSASRMMGNFGSAAVGGLLLGPLIATVAAPVGIEGLFLAGAATTAVTACGLLYAIPAAVPAVPAEPEGDATRGETAPTDRWWTWVLLLGGLDMFTALVYSALEPVLPLYLSTAQETSARTAISLVFIAGLAASGLSLWVLGRCTQRLRPVALVATGLPILAAGLAAMAGSARVLPVAAAFVVFMVGYALLFLSARRGILELKTAAIHQGKAFGLFGMVSDVGNIVGPIAGIALYELTGRVSFLLLGALAGLFLVALAASLGRAARVPARAVA
jgi:MFS family permease